ncbi:hypothetical protein ACIQHU_39335 [Streptomyces tendae]|uniref:hypothetical protein n=1 Tax=Streptomyces tendae TaxID=1932 RepID=UPI003827E271
MTTSATRCPTCGPTTPEPHPCHPVLRCSNCKEHLSSRDVLAWLETAISEREQAAQRLVGVGGCPDWGHCQSDCTHESRDAQVQQDVADRLRRCTADRKLLELHRPQQTGAGFPDIQECRTCSADSLGDGYQYLMPAPCPSLLALAEGYGWNGAGE